jgi:hypothetical protein
MSADLGGVRRKLARAKAKLDTLQNEVTAYMEPAPFRIVAESQGNHQGIVCRIDREPDESWADEMAEIAYQARSALDVLIPQLVLGSGNTPRRGTQFPIFQDQDDYTRKRGGRSPRESMLRGVATRFRRIIDGVQPYQRGQTAYRDPLAVLSTISNRDKQRIFNGGDRSGLVTRIRWSSWGGSRAVGSRRALYIAPGQISANGRVEAARIVLFHLGYCHGRHAYDAIEWYFPRHREHFQARTYIDSCTGQYR